VAVLSCGAAGGLRLYRLRMRSRLSRGAVMSVLRCIVKLLETCRARGSEVLLGAGMQGRWVIGERRDAVGIQAYTTELTVPVCCNESPLSRHGLVQEHEPKHHIEYIMKTEHQAI
jgi:hypothetical protein